ncbi:FAD-dependent oxidoreductase [Roseomonas sp. AR75]|uniref:FAD-dependent oxidoreductase n=1 Tax=Roseomonas sp. AR75 TaxID=2562311 RepID=UPI0010C02439|nr:FAD-dependent oxidoreductase [Roseomonas sp. AR75]
MTERTLVLAGGGHAHVEVLRQLAERPLAGWRAVLVTRESHSPYSGMLPGVAAGLYRPDQALIDARALTERAGASLVLDRVEGLDPEAQLVLRADGPPIPYDLLSIDTGATPDVSRVPGAAEHALPLKPIDGLLPRLDALFAEARAGQTVAVVGGGAAGCEMALAMAARLGPRGVRVVLAVGRAGLLPDKPAALRRRVTAEIARRGIALRSGQDVAAVTEAGLRIGDEMAPAEAVLWATGAAAAPWLAHSGLPRDAAGFLLVEPSLRVTGRTNVFAAGDVSSLLPKPLPKSGVVAVRQGPVLARNLRAAAEGRTLEDYVPQRDWLVLLSLGDGRALGTRNGLVFSGRWVWWWKDWLDRRFMARYQGNGR